MHRHVLLFSRVPVAYFYGRPRQGRDASSLVLADCRVYTGYVSSEDSPMALAFRLASDGPRDGKVSGKAPRMTIGVCPGDIMLDVTAEARLAWEGASNWDLMLTGPGPNKIDAIKAVRELTGLGLKDAKDLVEATANGPRHVKCSLGREAAAAALEVLQKAGAAGRLDPSS